MEKLNSEDGQLFIKNTAAFIRTHEKALANALLLRRQSSSSASSSSSSSSSKNSQHAATTASLAAALSFGAFKFASHHIRPAKLTLTPHHLFYLLSRFEDLSVAVGPMNVRLENIQTETLPSYVSFLNKPSSRSRSDRDSIHSVSSVRSVISNASAVWSSLGWSFSSSSKKESSSLKAKAAVESDLKYLYSAFTKIPCLRLAPDNRARLIRGYEEFPFDTAVPLHAFKNLSSLEVVDIDFRSLFGWDRLAEQLRTLTVKRANIEDPADLLTGIVLDDMDKRRRRSSKAAVVQPSPGFACEGRASSISVPVSPTTDPHPPFGPSTSPQAPPMLRVRSEGAKLGRPRTGSFSPTRPSSSKQQSGHHHHHHHHHHRHHHHHNTATRGTPSSSSRIRRTGSASSYSSDNYGCGSRNGASSSNLLSDFLPPSKWRFLQHLGLPENSLTCVSASSLAPVADTLQSIDLSSNLFNQVPECLTSLIALRAVNLSTCMIESLHSLSRNPLPAITALNLRGNRLRSLAGIERLLSLEKLDLRNNQLSDPTEIARLTGLPEIREIWVSGNPFVKTHPGYRVVIFNLFRRTPGYSEDIIIDGTGPGYAERKQLVDRVAEPEGAPVVRPVFPDVPTVVNNNNKPTSGSSDPMESVATRPSPAGQGERHDLTVQQLQQQPSNITAGNTTVQLFRRSKKGRQHRPQVVDSSVGGNYGPDDSNISPTTISPMQQPMKNSEFSPLYNHHQNLYSPSQNELDPDSSHAVIYRAQGTAKFHQNADLLGQQTMKQGRLFQPSLQSIDFDVESDVYRRNLEALKHGVGGASWLTMLGEQSWESPQKDMISTNNTTTTATAAALHWSNSTLAPSTMQTNCLTGPSSNQVILSGAPT